MTEQEKREWSFTIANTIIDQIGGNRFIAMTGAKDFSYSYNNGNPCVEFKIMKNSKRINHVRIIYVDDVDTYTMQFFYVHKKHPIKNHPEIYVTDKEVIAEQDDVYCDTLESVFKSNTGLNTMLF